MKIKLVGFPFRDYQIGEIVDLGEEKNRSMVALGRAVFYEPPEKPKPKKPVTPKPKTTTSETKEENILKKLLTNKLGQQVQEKKKKAASTPARGPDGKFVSKE